MSHRILIGDLRTQLATLPGRSVHCCVTSPPYWGLRSYLPAGHPDKSAEIGGEASPAEFVATMVEVFAAVRRVLRDDGVLFVNLGDSYSVGKTGRDDHGRTQLDGYPRAFPGVTDRRDSPPAGLKPGDLCNVPHRVAAALQADGWFWRSTIVWAKRSPMPESVTGWRWRPCREKIAPAKRGTRTDSVIRDGNPMADHDGHGFARASYRPCPGCEKCAATGGLVLRRGKWRPTTAHEYVFMFAKSERYFCDGDAVQEKAEAFLARGQGVTAGGHKSQSRAAGDDRANASFKGKIGDVVETRNPRSVWTLSHEPYKGAHFATFPSELPRRLILAGTSGGGCCGACGAPLAPVVESERVATRPGTATKITGDRMNDGNRDAGRHVARSSVVGYRATCGCDATVAPCVVLDPFLGSGTTLQVARALGRDGIGVELNAEYAKLAEERIATLPKWALPAKATKKRRKSKSQREMFQD